jgi:hypothetical protein
MSTMVMSIGVTPYEGEKKITACAIFDIGKKTQCLVPSFFVQGKDLEAQRKEAHRHIDECVNAFITNAFDNAYVEDSRREESDEAICRTQDAVRG